MNAATFLGIDGGGTHTRAFVTDDTGLRCGWGEAGLSNPHHASAAEWRANLGQAICLAHEHAGLDISSCLSVFAGMAGITTESGRELVRKAVASCGLERASIAVDHDIRIALAGGLAGKPGIALIVGTGSSCYGRTADGRTWQTGGWEALISDEGSAFYLGREAIAAAARMADGRMEETELRQTVFQWLEIQSAAELPARIHTRGLSRSDMAAFAPQVVTLAARGDMAAAGILESGAVLLADLVAANDRMLPTGPGPDVVITGGLGTAAADYRARIEKAIRARLPTVKLHNPLLPPATGAAMLAMQEVGRAVPAAVIDRWKQAMGCSQRA